MARKLTPERQKLRIDAIRLRQELGWSGDRIAGHLQVNRPTIYYWLSKNNTTRASNNLTPLSPNNIYCMDCLDGLRRLPHNSVDHRTIGRWLSQNNGQATQAIMDNIGGFIHNGLSTAIHPRYLVFCQKVEKFRPPDGITFPLIIADPPWNVSDPGHKRERKARPHPFTKDFGP